MKIKDLPRYIYLIALLLLTASALMLGARKAETTLESQIIAPSEALIDPCLLPDVYCEELTPISCYTGWESHGANGREDGVSVATYLYPQGTWIHIDGIGDRRVDTVTSTKYADRVDVWTGDSYEDYLECLDWGVQYREVIIN